MKQRTRSTVGRLSFVMVLLTLSAPVAAQQPLTLDQALERARVHNRNLEAARARLDQSAADVSQAWAALLPKLSAQGKYTHNYKDVELNVPIGDLSDEPIVFQKLNQLNAGLTAVVPLVVPSAYPALSAVQQARDARTAEFSVTETTVLFSVAQAFYAAAGADEILVARKNAVDVAQETLENAKVLHQGGKATEVEVMRAEVALVRAEQAEREAADMQAQAYRALSTLIGAREPIRVAPPDETPQEALANDNLVDKALHLRPEFALYQRSIDAADATGDAAAWRWAPTLSAFGNLQAYNYKGVSGDNYSWAIGLQLDWILYDGGVRDAQNERASAQRREFAARLDALSDSVTDDVINARRAILTKRSALQSAMRAAELSRETLRLVQIQYEGGKATQLDLLQAQDSLVASEVQVARARFALSLADIELKRAAGLFPSKRTNP
jgi:multidrug efflux system outer membrane protein